MVYLSTREDSEVIDLPNSHERPMQLKIKASIEVLLYRLKCSLQGFKNNEELDIIESQRITRKRITPRVRSFQTMIVTGRLGKEE